MWDLLVRNLLFRRRQFLVAIAGTSLVFAMALLVSGMSSGFSAEASRTLRGIGGDGWVVPAGTPGPFGSLTPVPQAAAAEVGAEPGVTRADPIVAVPEYVSNNGKFVIVTMIGHRIGGLGEPRPSAGRRAAAGGEVVVDRVAGFRLGDALAVGGHRFTVVGLTDNYTMNAGQATAYLPLADAQAVAFGGRDLISGVVLQGVPGHLPVGLAYMTRAQVLASMLRPMANARKSIANTRLMLWLVAIAIVAGVMYVAALERIRDFAVLKAVGARSRTLVAQLVAEAVIVAVLAATIAILLSRLLTGAMKGMPIAFTSTAQVATVVAAVVVGVVASVSGVRRALRTDPALAFGAGA
jgi:putative ABC transport system permease protein